MHRLAIAACSLARRTSCMRMLVCMRLHATAHTTRARAAAAAADRIAQFPRDQVLNETAAVFAAVRAAYPSVKKIGVQG